MNTQKMLEAVSVARLFLDSKPSCGLAAQAHIKGLSDMLEMALSQREEQRSIATNETHVCRTCRSCRVPDKFVECGPCYRRRFPRALDEICPEPIPLSATSPEVPEEWVDALRPLASLLKPHHENLKDDQPLYGIGSSLITAGDLRRAAALLASKGNAS